MTVNHPRDDDDDRKYCQCGHPKASHLTVNQTPAGPAYLYKGCRKDDCDCSSFDPVRCDACDNVMTRGKHQDILLCGPSTSGCEGTKPIPDSSARTAQSE